MIITCEKCSTNFNLDDSLVNEKGSNVRCSVCKHIFTASPISQGMDDEPDFDDSLQGADSFEDWDAFEADNSLSFEDFENKDLEAEDDEFKEIESDPLEDDEFEPEFDDEDDDTASETKTDADLPDADEDNPVLEDTAQEAEPEPIIPPQDDSGTYDDVPEQETEPDIDSSEPAAAPEPSTETLAVEKPGALFQPYPKYRIHKKKPLVGTPVLILLLLFLLIAGAYIASILTGYNIPYLSDIKISYIERILNKKQAVTRDVKPVLDQKSIHGRFVANPTAGTLFVIDGNVENPSNGALLRHIEISGPLIIKGDDGKNKTVKTRNAFCGNIIDTDKLKTQTISDINSQLAKKEGRNNANMNIGPGKSIPFMVVFSDLPENLHNFTVKIAGFEKIDNG